MSTRTEEIDAILRDCTTEGYDLTRDEAEEVRAEVLERGPWTKIRLHVMSCWWDVMEEASRIVHARRSVIRDG